MTTHSFPKMLATLIDDEGSRPGLAPFIWGHPKVSMSQDRYMIRGRVHAQVAELLDRTVRIND